MCWFFEVTWYKSERDQEARPIPVIKKELKSKLTQQPVSSLFLYIDGTGSQCELL